MDPSNRILWTARTSRTNSYGLLDESFKLLRNRGYELRHTGRMKNYYLFKGPVFIGMVRFTEGYVPTNSEYKQYHEPSWHFFQGIGKNLTLKTKLALQDMCHEWKNSLVFWDYFND